MRADWHESRCAVQRPCVAAVAASQPACLPACRCGSARPLHCASRFTCAPFTPAPGQAGRPAGRASRALAIPACLSSPYIRACLLALLCTTRTHSLHPDPLPPVRTLCGPYLKSIPTSASTTFEYLSAALQTLHCCQSERCRGECTEGAVSVAGEGQGGWPNIKRHSPILLMPLLRRIECKKYGCKHTADVWMLRGT